MIWIVSLILVTSISYNIRQYQQLKRKEVGVRKDDGLSAMIDQVRSSGSSLPDLSIDLTDLAANNLRSVDAFRKSSTDMQNVLNGSVARFHEMDNVGQQNIISIEKRIEELKGFIDSIEELNRHYSSITDTVNLLEDISSQTSILALNASVEAARAGAEGRGFAVIAKSVRELASKSLTASDTIKEITGKSKEKGQAIAKGVHESSQALGEIFQNINQIVSSLKEGLHTFEENSTIVDNIISSANQLDNTVEQNLSSVRESSHIGIKLGVYLDDLYTKSAERKEQGHAGNRAFIKPEHVFHFNLTNTFPSILKLLEVDGKELDFPASDDKKIKPVDVYGKLCVTVNELTKRTGIVLRDTKIKSENVKPVDVLKLSVAFCESLQRKYGREMLDKSLVMKYMNWKKGREISPSDVYFLIDHFHSLLSKRAKVA